MNPYASMLRDVGDIARVSNKEYQTTGPGLILAVCIPCAMAGATGTIAADAMKHPTTVSRKFIGGMVGGVVAGAGTTTLTGGKLPALALFSMVVGASLGIFGATNLRKITSTRSTPPTASSPAPNPPATPAGASTNK